MALPSYVSRTFSGGAAPGTLSSDVGASDTTISLNIPSANGWNLFPASGGYFVVTLDYGLSSEEKVLCSGISVGGSGLTATLTVWASGGTTARGYDGTTAQTHSASQQGSVLPVATSIDFAEANKAVVNTVAQVAAAGDILVGTAANTMNNLAKGSANQVLTVASGGTGGLAWKTPASAAYYSASTSAPSSPTQGQMWYQTDTSDIKVYSGSSWLPVFQNPAPSILVHLSGSTQSLSSATPGFNQVQWNATPVYSTGTAADKPTITGSKNQYITINQAGIYQITFNAMLTADGSWTSPGTGQSGYGVTGTWVQPQIHVGSDFYVGPSVQPWTYWNQGTSISVCLPVTSGTTIDARCITSTGNAKLLGTSVTTYNTYMSVAFVGESL